MLVPFGGHNFLNGNGLAAKGLFRFNQTSTQENTMWKVKIHYMNTVYFVLCFQIWKTWWSEKFEQLH